MNEESEIEQIFEDLPPKEAFLKLQPLAKDGNAIAQFYIAELYGLGDIGPRDDEKAFEWYEKSAKNNYFRAHHYLGVCLFNGIGCKINLGAARKHFKIAAAENFKPCLLYTSDAADE